MIFIDRTGAEVPDASGFVNPSYPGSRAGVPFTQEMTDAEVAASASRAAAHEASIMPAKIIATKTEARRRILAFLPEWKQANLTARAVDLMDIGRANWTAGQLAEWDAGAALWERVKAIRAASDAIEVRPDLTTIDVTDNQYWPE